MSISHTPGFAANTPFWGEGPADDPTQVFQLLPLPIGVLLGAELVYQQVNAAYQQLFPGRQLLGLPWAEALPELAAQPIAQGLREVFETGSPLAAGAPVALPAASGEPASGRHVRFSGRARHDAAGQVDGVLVFAQETAAPEQAPATLQEAQAALAAAEQALATSHAERQQLKQDCALMEQRLGEIPALVALLYGPEHKYTFVNPAYQVRFPDRQLVGRTYSEAMPEAYAQGFGAWLNQVYSTGETTVAYDSPLRFRNAQGQEQQSYFDFTFSATGQDTPQGVMIVAFDVTARTAARQQRALRQQQLLAIFEQAPAALALLHGPQYVVEMANPSICAMWGRELAQVAGLPLFEALPEIVGHGFEEILAGVRETGRPFLARELPVELLRGGRPETVYFDFVYQPLFDNQGQVDSVAIVAIDVSTQVLARQHVEELNKALTMANTELENNNKALRESNIQLDRIKQNLEQFLAGAWQELNRPLTALEALWRLGRLRSLPTLEVDTYLQQLREVATRFQPPA